MLIINKRQHKPKLIGEYLHHTECRFCLNHKIITVIDFGNVPLAGGFLKENSTLKDFCNERLYPLRVAFCPKCYLLQVIDIVDSKILYKDYKYFSSAITTLVDHFQNYAKEIKDLYPDSEKRLIVEIGCNDGVFLKPLKRQGFNVVGIDIAENVVRPLIKEGFDVVINSFEEKSANKIKKTKGKADIIVASNSFAHIDDMHDVLKGIKTLLKDDGILLIEVYYLPTSIKGMQYDMIYHDHESYYSLIALNSLFKMYDMEIYNIKPISNHGGSMRYYVQNKNMGKNKINKNVLLLRKKEIQMGLDKIQIYREFFKKILKTKRDLIKLLTKLKKQNKSIAGYGASGRATMIMNFCGIGDNYLDYVIDDAPAKQGMYTPGSHLKIVSSDILDNTHKKPDYCLIFAWSFIKEISKRKSLYLKNGGKFITPLPSVKIIP